MGRRKADAAGASAPPAAAPEGERAALFTFTPAPCADAEALAVARRAALRVPPPPTGAFARLCRCARRGGGLRHARGARRSVRACALGLRR
jgi:hypothetical protein